MALISMTRSFKMGITRNPRKEIFAVCRYAEHSIEGEPESCHLRIDHAPGRETVGFGISGVREYFDRMDYPCPAIRYKADTSEIKLLREKEKGDWHNLSMEEKKELYRASFRLTLAEALAPTGRGKSYIGWTFFLTGIGLWVFMLFHYARNRGVYTPDHSLEYRQAVLQRMIAMQAEPISGIASKWDYEKDDWKKK